jgi:hypothetical protein
MRIANYEYTEIIGQGAFGKIYKGWNVRTGEKVVIKMESHDVDFSSLKHESNILNILYSKFCRNIPPTYWYGTTTELNRRVLVMPFYEESLETFIPKSEIMASRIMRSAVSILNHIHDKYVVHRDIKPANFMIHNDELVLIDFGLASFYVDSGEKHILQNVKRNEHIIGTPKYASWNVHCGKNYSRRDDLLSVVYIGLFLIYGADLWIPDCTFESKLDNSAIIHPRNQWFKMQKDKANIYHLSSRWKELADFSNDVYALSFQERPSYKKYIDSFSKTI